MKPALAVANDLLRALVVGHVIASYGVAITWLVMAWPHEDKVLSAVMVVFAPAMVPFSASLAAIFGIAHGDEKYFAAFTLLYAIGVIVTAILIYKRLKLRRPAAAAP